MKSWALAILAAASTSSRVALPPMAMFSAMVPLKSTGSCETIEMFSLSHLRFSSRRSTPSSRMRPSAGS